MTTQILKRLFESLAFANVGTLSEFRRVLHRREPLTGTAAPIRATVSSGNVVPFRREEATTTAVFHNPLLPKARLKP